MSLSSSQLEAFHHVARTLNISRAAKELRLTQSALTQRLHNLEAELGMTLLVRGPRGVRPTPAGERLLRYCQARAALEEELLRDLKGDARGNVGGALRLAAFSTVLRSVIVPTLAPLVAKSSGIQLQLFEAELRELPDYLLRGEVDYVVVDSPIDRQDVLSIRIGSEENVLVEGRDIACEGDVYLDHDPEDSTTLAFLRLQGQEAPVMRRSFLDEIYAIMDGVALGLGRAVIPRHLAAQDERLRIVPGKTTLEVPVFLCHLRQPFYTKLHEQTVATLTQGCERLLKAPAAASRKKR